jgi:hypothetical protein
MHRGTTGKRIEIAAGQRPDKALSPQAAGARLAKGVLLTRETEQRCSTNGGCAAVRDVPRVERRLARINLVAHGTVGGRMGRRRSQCRPRGAVPHDLAGRAKQSRLQYRPGRPVSAFDRSGSRWNWFFVVAVQNGYPQEVDLRQQREVRCPGRCAMNVGPASHSSDFT